MAESGPATTLAACKLAFIGAGNMAEALIKGLVHQNIVAGSRISASSPSGSRNFGDLGVHYTKDNAECVSGANIIVLAVKPMMVCTAIDSIRHAVAPDTLVVSIAAGVKISTIQEMFLGADNAGTAVKVVRAMPNTPCAVGHGATGFASNSAVNADDVNVVKSLFQTVGIVEHVTEAQLDAVTGLSGSGPAYVLMMLEALADGGVAAGLPRGVAQRLATQLLKGTALMVQHSDKHPAELKDLVASPGGTTIAGMYALEDGKFRGTVMSAVIAATDRARELANPK